MRANIRASENNAAYCSAGLTGRVVPDGPAGDWNPDERSTGNAGCLRPRRRFGSLQDFGMAASGNVACGGRRRFGRKDCDLAGFHPQLTWSPALRRGLSDSMSHITRKIYSRMMTGMGMPMSQRSIPRICGLHFTEVQRQDPGLVPACVSSCRSRSRGSSAARNSAIAENWSI